MVVTVTYTSKQKGTPVQTHTPFFFIFLFSFSSSQFNTTCIFFLFVSVILTSHLCIYSVTVLHSKPTALKSQVIGPLTFQTSSVFSSLFLFSIIVRCLLCFHLQMLLFTFIAIDPSKFKGSISSFYHLQQPLFSLLYSLSFFLSFCLYLHYLNPFHSFPFSNALPVQHQITEI